MELSECSLNSATIRGSSLDDVLDLAARYGFGGVGLWRDVLDDADLLTARGRVDDTGLRVTSVCRGGMFPQPTESLRRARLDDNRRAVDQARALGADCLVLVCGPPLAGDLASARGRIREGIEQLIPYAVEAGVALAVEPFHPMLAATRSAITSLREAAALTEGIGHPHVGLAVDSYHIWWETDLHEQIIGAGDRIMAVQLADWCTPIEDELASRGMPGEGDIDMAGFVTDCRSAGYSGLVEVEVLSSRWWSRPAELTVAAAAAALGAVANPLPSS
ncbi:sugar phosphate isomerase/epimerase [Gordonia terrae C-6]|uniref:Sugar phosphate isomerase/epimerase n=1 Tax=Gordonia terrae C-6 TaxID=1316928 RepID=R7YFN6_9ACTN|nr:sugar phosphate isomerase/epimerase family protein [Gordonia terrae]EON34816.1 sugar phosphate isomerase/epimerase [Gordonia terrae C-6]